MASLHSITDGEMTELKARLSRAGFSAEIVREINKSDDNELAKFMCEALLSHLRLDLVHGLFTQPEDQIARVRDWNAEFGWGITDEAFAAAERSVPEWPEERLVAVVLVPYLAGDGRTYGVERTFQQFWARVKERPEASCRWDGYDSAGPDRLRLLGDIRHEPGLRWEVIDFGANRDRKPEDVCSAETSPHAGVLAAAALHPEWVKATYGKDVPYVWAPGYEVSVPGGDPWQYVPYLCFDRYGREVRLPCGWRDGRVSGCAVPSFFVPGVPRR